MKKRTRMLSLLLAAALLFALLSGCGKTENPQTSGSPSVSPAESSEDGSAPADFKADTLIMTINSRPVYWDEFHYWMTSSLQYAGNDLTAAVDWTQTVEGVPLSEYVLSDALEAVNLYRVIESKCEELDIGLTEEDEASIASMREENITQFGGEAEYLQYLEDNNITEDLMTYLLTVSCLYYNLFVELYGADGEKISDEDALAFGTENGYYRAKHILLSSKDDADNPLSEEQIAANYDELTGLLEQLKASDDPIALFDELMQTYSQDPGLATYPDGYQFVSGDMDPAFEGAVVSLEDFGFSDIVEMSSYGYTIVMRLPLEPDGVAISDQYGYSLRYNTATTQYQTLASSWSDEAQVEYAPAFETIKPEELF